MASKKTARIDYRLLKKMLNPYVKFSFKTPRKGKDFSPQQKAAITRQFNKIGSAIIALKNDEASFIRGQKIPGMLNTRVGAFVQYPNAKVKKTKLGIKTVETRFGKRRELYLPFPKGVKNDLKKIKNFVAQYQKQRRPDYIRWATMGQKTSEVYNPDTYTLYGAEYFNTKAKGHRDAVITGVFFGWRPEGGDFVKAVPSEKLNYKSKNKRGVRK